MTALQPRGRSCIDHWMLDCDLGEITTRDVVDLYTPSDLALMSIHGRPRGNLHAPTRLHMTRRMPCYMATRFSKRMMGLESLSLQHVGWYRPVHDCNIKTSRQKQ